MSLTGTEQPRPLGKQTLSEDRSSHSHDFCGVETHRGFKEWTLLFFCLKNCWYFLNCPVLSENSKKAPSLLARLTCHLNRYTATPLKRLSENLS